MIDYCKYHKDNPPEEIQKPLKSTNLVECGVSEWDSEYVNIEQEAHYAVSWEFSELAFGEVLFELILAANYLDIKSLLDLTCAKVASMIKGKNTEEIRILPQSCLSLHSECARTDRYSTKSKRRVWGRPEGKQFNIVNDFTPEEEAQAKTNAVDGTSYHRQQVALAVRWFEGEGREPLV